MRLDKTYSDPMPDPFTPKEQRKFVQEGIDLQREIDAAETDLAMLQLEATEARWLADKAAQEAAATAAMVAERDIGGGASV